MKRISVKDFCRACAIASLVTAQITVVSPTLANEPQPNQDGAEELNKGGPIEDKYVPSQEPGPNYPAADEMLQQDAEKAKAKGLEDTLRQEQDEASIEEDYDTGTDIASWPDEYWYWPYSLFP